MANLILHLGPMSRACIFLKSNQVSQTTKSILLANGKVHVAAGTNK